MARNEALPIGREKTVGSFRRFGEKVQRTGWQITSGILTAGGGTAAIRAATSQSKADIVGYSVFAAAEVVGAVVLAKRKIPIEIKSPENGVELKQFTLKNAAEMFRLIDNSRNHLSQNGDITAGKYLELESVRESIRHPKDPKRLRFRIGNERGKMVGSINITPDAEDPNRAEIGYWIGEDYVQLGYAKKAAQLLTQYGFDYLGYKTIYAQVADENAESRAVLLATGYRETGEKDGKIIFERQKAA